MPLPRSMKMDHRQQATSPESCAWSNQPPTSALRHPSSEPSSGSGEILSLKSSGFGLPLGMDMRLAIEIGLRAVDRPGPDQDFASGGRDGQLLGLAAAHQPAVEVAQRPALGPHAAKGGQIQAAPQL